MSEKKLPSGREKNSNDIVPCGLLRRLAIMLYDALVVLALLIVAAALAMAVGFDSATALKDWGYTLYLLTVWFFYLAWCWRKGGMTVGMRAWRVRIQNESGDFPGWGQCLLRFVTSLLSAAVAGAGFIWSLFDSRKRCWHDILSRTRLLRY